MLVVASTEDIFSLMLRYSPRLQTCWQGSLCSGSYVRRAHWEGDAWWGRAETTVLVVCNNNGISLGVADCLLSSSFSLGEVHSFKDRDGSLDGESSVLGLDGEGSMCWLSAFAAVGLLEFAELGVGNSRQRLNLSCFSELLEALTLSGTEAWDGAEVAWAWKVLKANFA